MYTIHVDVSGNKVQTRVPLGVSNEEVQKVFEKAKSLHQPANLEDEDVQELLEKRPQQSPEENAFEARLTQGEIDRLGEEEE